MKKLNEILLIDDDRAVNVFHQITLEESDVSNKVTVVTNGKEALEYLVDKKRELNGNFFYPDLILLDINMPVMDGFEFLEAYEQINKEKEKESVVIILTTSLLDSDRAKVKEFSSVKEFVNKPFTEEKLKEIIQQYHS